MSDKTLVLISDFERDRLLNRAQRKGPLWGSVVWVNVVFTLVSILLTLVTAGLFLIVLLVMYLNRDTETVIITVDEYGRRTIS
jgi:hypothetical protein